MLIMQTVVYHDVVKGDVYISQDEGSTWERADISSGQASIVVPHPFDTRSVRSSLIHCPFRLTAFSVRPSS